MECCDTVFNCEACSDMFIGKQNKAADFFAMCLLENDTLSWGDVKSEH